MIVSPGSADSCRPVAQRCIGGGSFGPRRINQTMSGRERADRISRRSIAGEMVSLAAAAAEVDAAPAAASTWLGHPRFAAERGESGRVGPDCRKSPVPHVLERKFRQRVRCMTRQHETIGADDDETASPAVHAGLGMLAEVIGS